MNKQNQFKLFQIIFSVLCTFLIFGCQFLQPQYRYELIFTAEDSSMITPDILSKTEMILRKRINFCLDGLSNVKTVDNNIVVELVRASDVSKTIKLATTIGIARFFNSDVKLDKGELIPPGADIILTDKEIVSVELAYSPEKTDSDVSVSLSPEGIAKISEYSMSNTGRYLVFSIDNSVTASLYVQEPIEGHSFVMTNVASGDIDAKTLIALLNSGRMPIQLSVLK